MLALLAAQPIGCNGSGVSPAVARQELPLAPATVPPSASEDWEERILAALPYSAELLEFRTLVDRGYPDRVLVLWMADPTLHPSNMDRNHDTYSCPHYSRGSYYSGPTRISLFDLDSAKIINTVNVVDQFGLDHFDIPYAIRPNHAYATPGSREVSFESEFDEDIERRPEILDLRDYTGEGRALQFVLADSRSCRSFKTALFGYDARNDRAVSYEVEVAMDSGREGPLTTTTPWVNYLFFQKQFAPGQYHYRHEGMPDDDEDGNGSGIHDRIYDFAFDGQSQKFTGTVRFEAQADVESTNETLTENRRKRRGGTLETPAIISTPVPEMAPE